MYEYKNERVSKALVILVCTAITFLVAWVFAGCTTKPTVINANETIVGSMDSLRQLRAINERASSILRDYNNFVTEQSERLRTGAVDVRSALTEYDNFVLQLIERIGELEELSRTVDQQILQGTSGTNNTLSDLRDFLSRESMYASTLLQESSGS